MPLAAPSHLGFTKSGKCPGRQVFSASRAERASACSGTGTPAARTTATAQTFAGAGAYSASKAGLLGFTRVLREETRGTGVRVTMILPGATDTPIWGDDGPDPGRLMPASAVADAVLYALKSDPGSVPEEVLLRPSRGDL